MREKREREIDRKSHKDRSKKGKEYIGKEDTDICRKGEKE